MTTYSDELLARLRGAFEPARDPVRAAGMQKYMRDQFPFLGIPTSDRRRLAKEALSGLVSPTEPELIEASSSLYALAEREYHYSAVELVARNLRGCGPGFLAHARWLVTHHSWWDTVDGLAADAVGPLVQQHPELAKEMDAWVIDHDIWVARTAILHQLRYKARTDAGRLFRYCELQAGHKDFFIRKAIGWALREYSKTDRDAVRSFIESHNDSLSGLSKREGMLWITGRKKRPLERI